MRHFPYAQQRKHAVNPDGEREEDAFKFIAGLALPKGVFVWVQAGCVGLIRSSVLNVPDMRKRSPDFVVRLTAVDIGRHGPTYVPEHAQITDTKLNPHLSSALSNMKSANTVLDRVNEKATAIMKSAGHITWYEHIVGSVATASGKGG